jgi:hypothetical protein
LGRPAPGLFPPFMVFSFAVPRRTGAVGLFNRCDLVFVHRFNFYDGSIAISPCSDSI